MFVSDIPVPVPNRKFPHGLVTLMPPWQLLTVSQASGEETNVWHPEWRWSRGITTSLACEQHLHIADMHQQVRGSIRHQWSYRSLPSAFSLQANSRMATTSHIVEEDKTSIAQRHATT